MTSYIGAFWWEGYAGLLQLPSCLWWRVPWHVGHGLICAQGSMLGMPATSLFLAFEKHQRLMCLG